MRTTNTSLSISKETDEKGLKTLIMGFQLHEEDLEIVENIIKPELERTTATKHDTADTLLTCLTYGIHKAYEEAEGVPFTLRMDRKQNKS